MNTYGNNFKISIFGASHAKEVGVIVDCSAAGVGICEEDFKEDLLRRKNGDDSSLLFGTTPRKEEDIPHITTGVSNGKTDGSPITISFENKNFQGKDYSQFSTTPRPSHADFVKLCKYKELSNIQGGGQSSGRMTVALVAAGVVAKKVLAAKGEKISVTATIEEIGGEKDPALWPKILAEAKSEGDSLGGVIRCVAEGVKVGVGEPFFSSLESQISQLAFSVPGVKGIEFGDFSDVDCKDYFTSSRLKGSEYNDPIISKSGKCATNHSGGINGGISNSNPVVFSVAVRPTASISKPQKTINLSTGEVEEISVKGRHDVSIALRCPVIIEAITAIVLADNLLVR